jgi:hypothetical protein
LWDIFLKKIVPIIKNQAVNLHTNQIMKQERRYQIVVVLLLMLPARIFCQQQMPLFAQKTPHLFRGLTQLDKDGFNQLDYFHQALSLKTAPSTFGASPLRIVSPDFYINHFGFLCRQELRLENKTYIPLRFRLGSLKYVDRMEGKDKTIEDNR